MAKGKIGILILGAVCFLSGCWDKVEIDKQAFVLGIGIDKYEEEKSQQQADLKMESRGSKVPEESPRNRYAITFTYPNTGLIAGKGEGDPNFVFTSVGENLYDVRKMLTSRINSNLFFGHTKLIVIGEEAAKDAVMMREILDAIERSPNLGRKIDLMITPGKAKEILNCSPPATPAVGLFIRDLMMQQSRSARIPDADLGYILRSMHESKTAIAPRIICSEDDVKVAGCAVLKDFKMLGWLGELETRDLMILMNKVRTTQVTVNVEGVETGCELRQSHGKMKVFERDGDMVVSFVIEMEGEVEQHMFEVREGAYIDKFIQDVETKVAQKLRAQIEETFIKIQKEYGADLVQAGEHLRKFQPDTWEKVKENWDEIFANAEVEITVKTAIRRVGTVR